VTSFPRKREATLPLALAGQDQVGFSRFRGNEGVLFGFRFTASAIGSRGRDGSVHLSETRMTAKPSSPSCERNRDPILSVLRAQFADRRSVLEIGSGTGQHAVYF